MVYGEEWDTDISLAGGFGCGDPDLTRLESGDRENVADGLTVAATVEGEGSLWKGRHFSRLLVG